MRKKKKRTGNMTPAAPAKLVQLKVPCGSIPDINQTLDNIDDLLNDREPKQESICDSCPSRHNCPAYPR